MKGRLHGDFPDESLGLLIEPEDPLPMIPQHIDHRHPVLARRGTVGRVEGIAQDMTMLVFSLHPGAGVIQLLPGAARQPRLHNGLFLLLQPLLPLRQQPPDLT